MATVAFVFPARSTDGVSAESGALTYITRRGTSTPAVGYSDSGLTTPVANPFVANALGLCGPIYISDAVDVTFSVRSANDASALLTVDLIDGIFNAVFVQQGQITYFEKTATGTGAQTVFTLTNAVASSTYQLLVTIDGVLQPASSISSVTTNGTDTTVTFSEAPPNASVIYFRSAVVQALSPETGDFSGVDLSASSVIATGGSEARTLADRFADRINVKDFGASGTLLDYADDAFTDAITIATATGRDLDVPGGYYLIDPKIVSGALHMRLDDNAIIRIKDDATAIGGDFFGIMLQSSDSSIIGGCIDGNKAGQEDARAAFNLASGRRFFGIWVVGTGGSATRLSNIKIKTKIINTGGYAAIVQYSDGVEIDIETDNCGGGLWLLSCTNADVRRAALNNLDNDSWKVVPIGVLCSACDNVTLDNINIPNQSGYDTIASGASLDDWFTGVALIDSDNVTASNWYICAKSDATMTKSVGISLLGLTKSNFSNITIKRYSSCNLELGALDDCDFVNVYGDGEYQRASVALWAGAAQEGCHLVNQGLYSSASSRIKRPVMNCTFTNMQMVRMLSKSLLVYLAVDCTWIGGKFSSSQYGIAIRSDNVNDSFPAPETQVTARLTFIAPEACWNEVAGCWNGGGTDVEFVRPNFANNGQAKNTVGNALRHSGTWAFATSGYFGSDASVAVARLRTRLVAPVLQDDQTVTTAMGSLNPAAPTVVSVERPELYGFGQTIRVNNGGTGPVDLIAQVLDINNDELTLDVPVTNFVLVSSGADRITTNGTACTFNNSQAAIITGRMWIKNSTNYRRVIAVAANGLSGTLESAFPSNLTTAAFEIVKTEIEQIRSQDYGLYTTGANDDGIVALECKFGAGNATGNVSLGGTGLVTAHASLNYGIGTAAPDYKLHVAGAIGFAPGASVAPVSNGDVVAQLTSNTQLTFKAKGADGTIRSNTLTLS